MNDVPNSCKETITKVASQDEEHYIVTIESANPLRRKGFRYFLMFREQNLNKRMNNSTLYSISIHITIRKKYDNRNMICIGNSSQRGLFLYCDGLRYGGTVL